MLYLRSPGRPVRRLPWVLLWLGAIAPFGVASSAKASRLAIITRGQGAGADKAAALVGHFVAETFDSDERFEPVDLSLALGNVERDRALKQFQVAEGLVQKAREAYDGLDLDTAEVNLKAALMRYERHCAWVDDFKKMADALLLLGAVRILKGNERGGIAAFEQAIGMVPSVEPDPKVFNPAMRVQFSQTVAEQRSAATGAIALTSAPSYSSVFLDGHFVGVTPLPIDNVTVGRHVVRIEREGFRPWGTTVDVVAHGEAQASATLRQAGHFDEFDSLAERAAQALENTGDAAAERTAALKSLIELLDADALFFSRVQLDGERVQVASLLFSPHGKPNEKKGEHAFAYEPQISTYEREVGVYLQESFGVSSRALRSGSKATSDQTDGEDEPATEARGHRRKNCGLVSCPTAKKIVVGTLFGASTAAVAFGGVEWILAKKGQVAWRKMDQTAPTQAAARVKAYNKAVVGDVLVGLGVVGAVGGVLAATLWHPVAAYGGEEPATEPAPGRGGRRGRSKGVGAAVDHLAVVPGPGGAHVFASWEWP